MTKHDNKSWNLAHLELKVHPYLLVQNTSERELEKRKLLAGKISADRDPIAESLFLEVEKKILELDSFNQGKESKGLLPKKVI